MGLSKFKNESLAGYHGPYNSNWPGPEPQSLVFEFLKLLVLILEAAKFSSPLVTAPAVLR